MRRTSIAVAGLVLVLAPGAAPAAQAAGAEHVFEAESYDEVEHFDVGEGLCVDWAGSFHEVRHGAYRLLTAPGGQIAGEIHVNGVVAGLVELVPDNQDLPTYTGSYREKVNGVITDPDPSGDELRIGQYRLESTLRGSDGSSLRLTLSGKLTVNGQGRVVVSREHFACE
jgi:hypothetical protein